MPREARLLKSDWISLLVLYSKPVLLATEFCYGGHVRGLLRENGPASSPELSPTRKAFLCAKYSSSANALTYLRVTSPHYSRTVGVP